MLSGSRTQALSLPLQLRGGLGRQGNVCLPSWGPGCAGRALSFPGPRLPFLQACWQGWPVAGAWDLGCGEGPHPSLGEKGAQADHGVHLTTSSSLGGLDIGTCWAEGVSGSALGLSL